MAWEKEIGYIMIDKSGRPNGGINIVDEIAPSGTILYVQVENIDAILKKAEELGESTVVLKKPIPHIGHFGILRDVEGNQIKVFTPLQM